MRVSDYITGLLEQGRYTVSMTEIKENLSLSHKAILQSLYRLKQKRRIVQIRKEFYGIIPPHYANTGTIPVTLFIDDLMHYLQKKYYVAFYSAAALHGAAHQQPMAMQIMTEQPLIRPIKSQKHAVTFFTKAHLPEKWLYFVKNEAGYLHVASHSLTIVDFIRYHRKLGGLNRMLPVIDELAEEVKLRQFSAIAKSASTSSVQRLGYIMDSLGKAKLSNRLAYILQSRKIQQIPLSLAHSPKKGKVNIQWNVIVNTELNIE